MKNDTKKKSVLVVVDCQNDFIDGVLGNAHAKARVPNIVRLIENGKFDCVVCTLDTHFSNYSETQEGRRLPVPHCIRGTDGWKMNKAIEDALLQTHPRFITSEKNTFGSIAMAELVRMTCEKEGKTNDGADLEFTVVGFCTDICVMSNAILLKSNYPEADIKVVANCTAGVTPESEKAAFEVMKMCQIEIV